jgi:hypothetical protein
MYPCCLLSSVGLIATLLPLSVLSGIVSELHDKIIGSSWDWQQIFFTDLNKLVEDAMVICSFHFLPSMDIGVYILEQCGNKTVRIIYE